MPRPPVVAYLKACPRVAPDFYGYLRIDIYSSITGGPTKMLTTPAWPSSPMCWPCIQTLDVVVVVVVVAVG